MSAVPAVNSLSSPRRRHARPSRPLALSAAAVAALGLLLVLRGSLLTAAWHTVTSLTWRGVVAIALVVIGHRVAQAMLLRSSISGLSLRQAMPVSEAYTGCSQAFVVGGSIGTGVKAAMLRSFGVPTPDIAASVVLTAAGPLVATWLIAFAHTAPSTFAGRADRWQALITVASLVVLVVPVALWRIIVRRPAALAAVAARFEHRRALAVRCAPQRWKHAVAEFDAGVHAEQARHVGVRVARRSGLMLLGSAVLSQVMLATLVLVTLRSLGAGAAPVSDLEVLRAFALARVAASLTPLPGGIGVLDIGLVGTLSRLGAQRSTVIAAIALYRVCTLLVPMLTGVLAAMWWRQAVRNRDANAMRIAVGKHSSA